MAHLRSAIGEAEEDFVVPLSRQAVALLHDLHKITGHREHLFPASGASSGRTISENTMNLALYAMGYRGIHCAHGFRERLNDPKPATQQGQPTDRVSARPQG
jgi:hypothetical protein